MKVNKQAIKRIIKEGIYLAEGDYVKTFTDFEDKIEHKIGDYYVIDANVSDKYIDLDDSLNVNLDDFDDEDFTNMDKVVNIWEKMTNKLGSLSAKGTISNGVKYDILTSFDGSGISYFLGDNFSFKFTISPANSTFEVNKKDNRKISSELDKFKAKVKKIIELSLKEINKFNTTNVDMKVN